MHRMPEISELFQQPISFHHRPWNSMSIEINDLAIDWVIPDVRMSMMFIHVCIYCIYVGVSLHVYIIHIPDAVVLEKATTVYRNS